MAFSFLALLEVVVRKAESFKFWGFFFPQELYKSCRATQSRCAISRPAHTTAVPPQIVREFSSKPFPCRAPKPACIISANVFYTGVDKASVCFTSPAGITSPLSGLSHCLLSQAPISAKHCGGRGKLSISQSAVELGAPCQLHLFDKKLWAVYQ